jgi:hypothetical protein
LIDTLLTARQGITITTGFFQLPPWLSVSTANETVATGGATIIESQQAVKYVQRTFLGILDLHHYR